MQISVTFITSLLMVIKVQSLSSYPRVEDRDWMLLNESFSSEESDVPEDDSYPEAEILQILETFPSISKLFRSETSPTTQISSDNLEDSETKSRPLCESILNLSEPKKLKNIHEQQKIIVNQKELTQIIYSYECSAKGQHCELAELFQGQKKGSCQQNYARRELLTYDRNIKKLKIDQFDIPCECVCVLK